MSRLFSRLESLDFLKYLCLQWNEKKYCWQLLISLSVAMKGEDGINRIVIVIIWSHGFFVFNKKETMAAFKIIFAGE